MPIDGKRSFCYHRTLWKLRDFAVELGSAEESRSSGISVVLQALCDRFMPGSLLTLRPAGLATITAREHMGTLRERLRSLGIDSDSEVTGAPERVLAVRYPAGEQDNSLMACTVLAAFDPPRPGHDFATANGGPAYFFAVAAEIQNNKGFSDAFDPLKLCFIGEFLEIGGWIEHPQVGPLIARWRAHFGFGPDYLDEKIADRAMLLRMREVQEAYRSKPAPYTPADFDRHVPAMWERMRRALPPIDPDASQSDPERPPDVIDVLNAGWTFAQLHLADLNDPLKGTAAIDRYEARVTFNRLVSDAFVPMVVGGGQAPALRA